MFVLWLLAIVGTLIGVSDLLNVVTATQISAPQQAAGAAMAVAWAVLPYVFARSCQGIAGREERELKKLNETLAASIQPLNSASAVLAEPEHSTK